MREFAVMEGVDPDVGADGEPIYPWFDAYWENPERIPLGIWISERMVGFCLLRDDGEAWVVAEFYVEPAHRRQQVGTAAIREVRRLCGALGGHEELRARVHHWNVRALSFWNTQGFVPLFEDADGVVTVTSV